MKGKRIAVWLLTGWIMLACSCALAVGLKLPAQMTEIADYAFYQCVQFQGELVLPSGVQKIGKHAFDGCTGLTGTVLINEGVVADETSFANTELTVIDLNDYRYALADGQAAVTAYTGPDAYNLTMPDTLGGCPVTAIGDGAFANCAGLTGTLTLPQTVVSIGERAFQNCTGITSVELPAGLKVIGAYAFGGCGLLCGEITLDGTAVAVDDTAFEGTAVTLVDSSLLRAAPMEKCTYRALSVVMIERNTLSYRPHGERERYHMPNMLAPMTATPYQVTMRNELTAVQLLDAIAETFKDATENDVSLLFFSGHGAKEGLHCEGGSFLRYVFLRQALDKIPGKKIVLIQACHSGAVIARGTAAPLQEELEDINNGLIETFAVKTRSGELLAGDYYVLASSHSDEVSWAGGTDDGEAGFGFFTYWLCHGSGYDAMTEETFDGLPADANGDGLITLDEAYDYTNANVLSMLADYDLVQNVQVYPENSQLVLWGK